MEWRRFTGDFFHMKLYSQRCAPRTCDTRPPYLVENDFPRKAFNLSVRKMGVGECKWLGLSANSAYLNQASLSMFIAVWKGEKTNRSQTATDVVMVIK